MLHMVRIYEDVRTVDAILTWLSTRQDQRRRDIAALNTLPLSALPDLQWLGDKELKSKKGDLLCDWLSEHGLKKHS